MDAATIYKQPPQWRATEPFRNKVWQAGMLVSLKMGDSKSSDVTTATVLQVGMFYANVHIGTGDIVTVDMELNRKAVLDSVAKTKRFLSDSASDIRSGPDEYSETERDRNANRSDNDGTNG